jgi:oligopeptide/dipeptide ABC transporter ATP-binding protein
VEARNLCQQFVLKRSAFGRPQAILRAVNNVSLSIHYGETLGLVGESGCGKTTLGMTLIHLLLPTSGEVIFQNKRLSELTREELRQTRLKMQIVFQDPYGSLNARMSVGAILQEPMLYHRLYGRRESEERVRELLEAVGLRGFHASRYPHEFSGGQRQRIAIARALTVDPDFIVCDEPVSALDVSVQSQVLNLFSDLKERLNLTYLFISHDLAVIRHISDRIGVMYLGELVELAPEGELFTHRLHPYTEALFEAMPVPQAGAKVTGEILEGDLPSPINPPAGCRFHTRCRHCFDRCTQETPILRDVGNEHYVACHLY